MSKGEKFVVVTGLVIELGSIIGLTSLALKRNNDAYNAQMECLDLELKNLALDIENYSLKRENERLKKENEIKQEES